MELETNILIEVIQMRKTTIWCFLAAVNASFVSFNRCASFVVPIKVRKLVRDLVGMVQWKHDRMQCYKEGKWNNGRRMIDWERRWDGRIENRISNTKHILKKPCRCNWQGWGAGGHIQDDTGTWDKGGAQESMVIGYR